MKEKEKKKKQKENKKKATRGKSAAAAANAREKKTWGLRRITTMIMTTKMMRFGSRELQ